MITVDIQKKILEGALELFMKFGVRSVSMDDIARHLSMSKKTLYQHFKDKDELVLMAAKSHLEKEISEYLEVEKKSQYTIEQLVEINKCIRRDFRDMNPSLLFDLQKYHPAAWQVFLDFKNVDIKNHIADIIRKGIKEGFFRKEVDPDVMAILRVESIQIGFNNQHFSQESYSLTEIQIMFFDHFVHGILTPRGKELYEQYLNNSELPEETTKSN